MFDDTCLRTCRGCLQPQIFHEKTWFCDFITWGKFCTYSDTLKNISSWNSCSFIFAKKMSRRQWHILNLCFNCSSASVFEVVVEIIHSNHSNFYKKWYQNLAAGFPSAFNSFQTGIFVCNAIFLARLGMKRRLTDCVINPPLFCVLFRYWLMAYYGATAISDTCSMYTLSRGGDAKKPNKQKYRKQK